LPAVRQKLHLSPCAKIRDHFSCPRRSRHRWPGRTRPTLKELLRPAQHNYERFAPDSTILTSATRRTLPALALQLEGACRQTQDSEFDSLKARAQQPNAEPFVRKNFRRFSGPEPPYEVWQVNGPATTVFFNFRPGPRAPPRSLKQNQCMTTENFDSQSAMPRPNSQPCPSRSIVED
jgi:hypothetical protein